ncbi:hypothetical protein QOT17_010946 [Balamuthia mandrillaris]
MRRRRVFVCHLPAFASSLLFLSLFLLFSFHRYSHVHGSPLPPLQQQDYDPSFAFRSSNEHVATSSSWQEHPALRLGAVREHPKEKGAFRLHFRHQSPEGLHTRFEYDVKHAAELVSLDQLKSNKLLAAIKCSADQLLLQFGGNVAEVKKAVSSWPEHAVLVGSHVWGCNVDEQGLAGAIYRRVKSLSLVTGKGPVLAIVDTTEVPLAHLFERGSIRLYTEDFYGAQPGPVGAYFEGPALNYNYDPASGQAEESIPLLVDDKMEIACHNCFFKSRSGIRFELDFGNYSYVPKHVERMFASWEGEWFANMDFKMETHSGAVTAVNTSKLVYTIELPRISLSVGWIPVYISLSIPIKAGITSTVEMSTKVTAGIEVLGKLNGSVTYTSEGGWTPSFSNFLSYNVHAPTMEILVATKTDVWLQPRLDMRLYGLNGPFVEFTTGLHIDYDFPKDCAPESSSAALVVAQPKDHHRGLFTGEARIRGNVKGEVGAQIKLWNWELASGKLKQWQFSRQLWAGCVNKNHYKPKTGCFSCGNFNSSKLGTNILGAAVNTCNYSHVLHSTCGSNVDTDMKQVVLRYTAPKDGLYVFDTGAGQQTVMEIRRGDCCGAPLFCSSADDKAYLQLHKGDELSLIVGAKTEQCVDVTFDVIINDKISFYYVNLSYPFDDQDGSFARPFSTLQQALRHTHQETVIKILPGRSQLKDALLIPPGNYSITIRAADDNPYAAQTTTLACGQYPSFIALHNPRLTIKGIHFHECPLHILLPTSNGTTPISVHFQDVWISGTKGYLGSGAVHLTTSSNSSTPLHKVTIERCRFTENESGNNGGALAVKGGGFAEVRILESEFVNNKAEKNGGSVALMDVTNAYIDGCTFNSSVATHNGGALYDTTRVSTVITRSIFASNTAIIGAGGAIYREPTGYAHSLALSSSLFFFNKAMREGGAIAYSTLSPSASLTIDDSAYFESNEGDRGGALCMLGGNLRATSSSFVCNYGRQGGALYLGPVASFGLPVKAVLENDLIHMNEAAKSQSNSSNIYTNGATISGWRVQLSVT